MKSRRSNVLASGGAARRQCNGENCCRGPSLVYIARAGASRRFISIAQAETFFHCPREEEKEERRLINSPGLAQLYRLIFDGEIAHIAARGLVGRKSSLANDPV